MQTGTLSGHLAPAKPPHSLDGGMQNPLCPSSMQVSPPGQLPLQGVPMSPHPPAPPAELVPPVPPPAPVALPLLVLPLDGLPPPSSDPHACTANAAPSANVTQSQ
jgi:hypothetical protein